RLTELLVQRRPTHQHQLILPHPPIHQRVDHHLHVRHRRRQQRRHPQHIRTMLHQRLDERVGIGVDPQINHLEPGALQHHRHQILPILTNPPPPPPNPPPPPRPRPPPRQHRPKDPHPPLHRIRRQETLSHEQDPAPKTNPDDPHPPPQRPRQPRIRPPTPP